MVAGITDEEAATGMQASMSEDSSQKRERLDADEGRDDRSRDDRILLQPGFWIAILSPSLPIVAGCVFVWMVLR